MNETAHFKLLDAVQQAVHTHSKASLKTLMDLLRSGTVPQEAINVALQQFEGSYYKTLAEAYSQALGAAMGVQQIMALPVSGLSLSTHLYGFQRSVNSEVLGLIKRHAQGMHDARKLAMDIYEGYGFREREAININPRNPLLPKYLREVLRDDGLKAQLERVIVRGRLESIKTPALRAAYTQALDQFENYAGFTRLSKALDVAFQERMRYFANRIAQTELHRAYSDQRAREYMAEDSLSVLQIRMSSTHTKIDVCDFHSKLDKYGLGPGCYPKAVAPKPGFHPFCRCVARPMWHLDAANAKERKKAEQAFLIEAGEKDGAKIMGSRERWFEAKTGKTTVESIFNRNKDPLYHFQTVGEVGGRIKAMNTLPNFELATINKNKLIGYALNENHESGGNKARVFRSALGFGPDDCDEIIRQVMNEVPKNEAKPGLDDKHGKRYSVDVKLNGSAGSANVRTAWIIRKDGDGPSLTSIYVKE